MESTSSKFRSNGNYIAFFDLDQTITRGISGKALALAGYRKGLLTTRDLMHAIWLSLVFRLNIIDPRKIIDMMLTWVKGLPVDTLDALCHHVTRETLLPLVYSEAKAEIEYHKTKNARIVILSSSLTAICREIAENLGIDDIICTEPEAKDGFLTGRPVGKMCFFEEKAIRLKSYCEDFLIDPSAAWYYGDSISDLPALECVGHPVCINPDTKLSLKASGRNWKILRWGN